MLRGGVGPYSYVGWLHHSKIDGSQFSMVLLKDKQIVFRTDRTQPWNLVAEDGVTPIELQPGRTFIELPREGDNNVEAFGPPES